MNNTKKCDVHLLVFYVRVDNTLMNCNALEMSLSID